MNADTIVALSSGGLPSGVGVVRVSGPAVRDVLTKIAGSIPQPRHAAYRTFRAENGEPLDRGLVLFFAAPSSFTGEDCVEFHVHGGRAVVAAIISAICMLDNCRTAEPGEFMRRAFLNGKIDLLEADATADLISAETEGQRRFAISNGRGHHAVLYADWRSRIVRIWAMFEATLDFADEHDVSEHQNDYEISEIATLAGEIRSHLAGYRKAEIVSQGFDVVIVGAPNVGKSSLLNTLARRDVAIVSDEPGTTRDLVEVSLDLDGQKVRLTDSAGIRETTSLVERIGIDRAVRRAEEADLILHLHEPGVVIEGMLQSDRPQLSVLGKADTFEPSAVSGYDLAISSVTGVGIPELLQRLTMMASSAAPSVGDVLPWKARHVEILRRTAVSLEEIGCRMPSEFAAEHLRRASLDIGRLSGDVDVEDLLDVIFSQFCIGK